MVTSRAEFPGQKTPAEGLFPEPVPRSQQPGPYGDRQTWHHTTKGALPTSPQDPRRTQECRHSQPHPLRAVSRTMHQLLLLLMPICGALPESINHRLGPACSQPAGESVRLLSTAQSPRAVSGRLTAAVDSPAVVDSPAATPAGQTRPCGAQHRTRAVGETAGQSRSSPDSQQRRSRVASAARPSALKAASEPLRRQDRTG